MSRVEDVDVAGRGVQRVGRVVDRDRGRAGKAPRRRFVPIELAEKFFAVTAEPLDAVVAERDLLDRDASRTFELALACTWASKRGAENMDGPCTRRNSRQAERLNNPRRDHLGARRQPKQQPSRFDYPRRGTRGISRSCCDG